MKASDDFKILDELSVDNDVKAKMKLVIDYFKEREGLVINMQNAQMFLIHLSLAIMRFKIRESVANIDSGIYEEVKANKYFKRAKGIWANLSRELSLSLSRAEEDYIIASICILLSRLLGS